MIDAPVLIQNAVPLEKQEEIKRIMFESLFPWFYRGTLSQNCQRIYDYEYALAPGLAHVFCNETGLVGNFFDYLKPVVDNACAALNVTPKKLTYGRTFLQMPLTTHRGLTIPHIDDTSQEHLVLVYYVLDSDGETVLFDRTYDFTNKVEDPTPLLEKDIVEKIMPRQGNILAFNGNTFHANILPQEKMRCIINFNIIL